MSQLERKRHSILQLTPTADEKAILQLGANDGRLRGRRRGCPQIRSLLQGRSELPRKLHRLRTLRYGTICTVSIEL